MLKVTGRDFADFFSEVFFLSPDAIARQDAWRPPEVSQGLDARALALRGLQHRLGEFRFSWAGPGVIRGDVASAAA